ncbi:MAG TPA: TnsA endonuclease N-terminal domain-containing protein [Edaphobacter sp.]|nr:TnsA endonuclease N-terminal domain-containing protein [Edaphobacter sp.]
MSKRHIGKSYCTVTGLKVSRRVGRMVEFESLLERDLITILEFSPVVKTFEEQPITIRWLDSGGKEHLYTPDFLIQFRGQRFLRKGSTAKPWLVEVKPQKRLVEQWDELRDRFRAAVAEASRRGWLFRILTDREIRTPYLRNVAFLQCAKGVDVDESFRSRIISLLKAEPLTLVLILDGLAATGASRPIALAQIWKMVLRAELVTDLALPLTMDSEFSLPKPEVGYDLRTSPPG